MIGCRPSRKCGCVFQSSSLTISGDGSPENPLGLETYDAVATEFPDTRPGPTERFEGMRVWTSDTKRLFVWDNTAGAWVKIYEPIYTATTGYVAAVDWTVTGFSGHRYLSIVTLGLTAQRTGAAIGVGDIANIIICTVPVEFRGNNALVESLTTRSIGSGVFGFYNPVSGEISLSATTVTIAVGASISLGGTCMVNA